MTSTAIEVAVTENNMIDKRLTDEDSERPVSFRSKSRARHIRIVEGILLANSRGTSVVSGICSASRCAHHGGRERKIEFAQCIA